MTNIHQTKWFNKNILIKAQFHFQPKKKKMQPNFVRGTNYCHDCIVQLLSWRRIHDLLLQLLSSLSKKTLCFSWQTKKNKKGSIIWLRIFCKKPETLLGSEFSCRVEISMPTMLPAQIMKTAIWKHPSYHFLICIQ